MRWVRFQLIVPNSCSLTRQEKRRIAKAGKRKFKAVIKQRNIRNRAAETNFNLELPYGYDDSEDNHWTAPLNDRRETVVKFPGEDNHWTASTDLSQWRCLRRTETRRSTHLGQSRG